MRLKHTLTYDRTPYSEEDWDFLPSSSIGHRLSIENRSTSRSKETPTRATHYCKAVKSMRSAGEWIVYHNLTDEWDRSAIYDIDTAEYPAGESAHLMWWASPSRPPPSLRRRFNELVQQWTDDTMVSSSSHDIYMHSAYQRVIGLGRRVLPLIIEEMLMGDLHWSWALSAITGENPAANSGSPRAATEAWLRWAKEQGLVAEKFVLA